MSSTSQAAVHAAVPSQRQRRCGVQKVGEPRPGAHGDVHPRRAGVRRCAADRDRPVTIESDSNTADDAKKTADLEGKVVLTQARSSSVRKRIVVRHSTGAFNTGPPPAVPRRFRHKQDGGAGISTASDAYRIRQQGRPRRFFTTLGCAATAGRYSRRLHFYEQGRSCFTVKSVSETPEQIVKARARDHHAQEPAAGRFSSAGRRRAKN